jgi:hypothetical protein
MKKKNDKRTRAKINACQSKVISISKWKSSTKGEDQPQKINREGEGKLFSWSCQMGLHVCSKLMDVLLKHIPLHEQGFMRDVIVLMEVGLEVG